MRRYALLMLVLISSTIHAEDWPQFLGPRRDGSSKETITAWSGTPRVVWRVAVGEGHSSPIVANGKVFLHDKVAGENVERLRIFDDGGKELAALTQPRGDFKSIFGVGPRATPTFTDGMVYTFGVTGRLSGAKVEEGGKLSPLFTKELLKEFNAKNLTFGISASPLVDGDLVIVPVGGKGNGVVAFNRTTGEVAWKALDDPSSYASPIVIGEGDKRQIVVLTQKGLASLSPKDGAVNWHFPYQDRLNESSTTPIVAGDLLIASSVTLGSVALRMTEKDGKPAVEKVWQKPELNCYFSTPVMVGKDHLYLCSGNLLNPTITLRCVDVASGKTLWTKTKVGKYHAALLKTGDDKLLMLGDDGYLTLIQPDASGYKELARSKVCGDTWAHPALAGNRLYLRDAKEMLCLELK